jgi:hypothetical protein
VQGVVGYGSSGLLGLGFSGGLQGGIEGIAGIGGLGGSLRCRFWLWLLGSLRNISPMFAISEALSSVESWTILSESTQRYCSPSCLVVKMASWTVLGRLRREIRF